MKNNNAVANSITKRIRPALLTMVLSTSIAAGLVARAAALVTTDPNTYQTSITGLGTPTVINFEDIDASPVNNSTVGRSQFNGGFYAGEGITFSNPNGDPLYIAPGGLFWNASNSLSVSSFPFESGSDTNDDLVVTFNPPVIAAGFTFVDNGSQSPDEFVQFLDSNGGVIQQVGLPPNFAPFTAFLGIVSVDRPIAKINIVEGANDGDDVAYDDFIFVPMGGCSAAPSGLVSWWPGDGNADDIKDGNPGMLMNGAMFAPGVVGPTFAFDGIDDFVKVPKAANLDMTNEVTIDFWMRAEPDNLMNNCCQGLVTTDFYAIEISGGGDPIVGINFFVNTGSSFVHTSDANGGGAVVTPGEWHHIAGTYDGTKLQLYVDGMAWGNPRFNSGTILPMLTDSFLTIGSEDGRTTCPGCIGNRYFKGQIEEVEVFNRALTASEIQSIFAAGVAGKCKNAGLTELGAANVWLGLKNSDDVGTKFDLLAEVFKNGSPVGTGQLNAAPGGSSGFNNAVLRTINLALSAPADINSGDTLSIRLSVRIAVGVPGHRSGTARLWFNDSAANSRFGATIGGVTSDYFLLNGFTLGAPAGAGPKKTIDVFVDRLVGGNPFKPFGIWSKTF